jgi:hypothetical protein
VAALGRLFVSDLSSGWQSFDPDWGLKNSNSVAKTPETLQAREALRVMAQAGNPQKTAKNQTVNS